MARSATQRIEVDSKGYPLRRALLWALVASPMVAVATGSILYAGFHDPFETQCHPYHQLFLAAHRMRDAALAIGSLPADDDAAQPLLAPRPQDGVDPWGRPFRYERLDAAGSRARVHSLGMDGRPGGSGCNADLVWWIDLDGVYATWSVLEEPAQWRHHAGALRPDPAQDE